ncbi:glycoside hydrolase family 38 protein [Rhizoctonia solani AG-1 IA]|uniref:alpha-mannosidase n=1 Tax=Thanatephorus cucumeris (strain AG1-IA) TaxID=983506 RepID=L8WKU3_THACA|nr:glycoside hydrolase family 38 protein [Rhizoctonia solani AG-1 IA]
MFTHRIDDADHVKLEVWSAPGRTKPTFEEAMKQDFKPAKKGLITGGKSRLKFQQSGKSTSVFSVRLFAMFVDLPNSIPVEFDPGCEAMIFTTSGVPLQGITGGFEGDRRVEFILDKTKREYSFVIESSCNGMFGISGIQNRYFTLASADLVVPNQDAWHLFWDFTTLREIIDTLPGNSPLQNIALRTANEIMNEFQVDDPDTIAKCRKIAENVFGANWAKEGADVYQKRREGHGADREQVWGIGHCHIDTAWLWPYSVTQQKVARSWSTQVDLMNRYPEHHFTCSSAQQYKWLEQLYPSLFEEVKSKIKQGLFEPIGGAWVEHDGNMPSGEAFIRQMTFGQRFFQSRFGIRCRTGWLPDSFGLSGSIPQLMRSAAYFTTLEHLIFHIPDPRTDTYTAQATTGDVRKAVTNHKNLESSDMGLLVFGNGDGGGGPLAKMLENVSPVRFTRIAGVPAHIVGWLRRVRAAGNNSRELKGEWLWICTPQLVSLASLTSDSFAITKIFQGMASCIWRGKRSFMRTERIYTPVHSGSDPIRQLVATLASLTAGYLYPKQRIDDSWEKLLLNQFHDGNVTPTRAQISCLIYVYVNCLVLPGSAIGMVYEDAEKLYSEITKECKSILEEAFDTLLVGSTPIDLNTPFEISTPGKVLAVNTTPFPRREVVQVPLRSSGDKSLRTAAVQITSDSQTGYVLMDARDGVGIAQPIGLFADVKPVSGKFRNAQIGVERLYSKEFYRFSEIIPMTFQCSRELIAPGKTGGLIIFSDQPNYWDVEIHHLEKFTQLEFNDVRILENGPVRASVEAQVKYGQSLITTTVNEALIEPSHIVEIPLDIRGLEATYECQFGHVSRPTHRNTTWDTAKFEYADFSEYGYGVALLSESKYGFAVTGNVLRVSLLRAATSPDAEQDQGEHSFSWAVLPHLGHFLESDVPQVAYTFNSPLHLRYVPDQGSDGYGAVSNLVHKPLFNVTGAPNVILETVKRGDDDDFSTNSKGERTIVLRLYEAFGGHARASLNVSKKLKVSKAAITNVLEDHIEDLKVDNSDDQVVSFPLKFRGFEVVTVKLTVSLNKAQHKSYVAYHVIRSGLLKNYCF